MNDDTLPESPADRPLRFLNGAMWVISAAAVYFGWHIAGWWGVGLALTWFAGNWIAEVKFHYYRDELLSLIAGVAQKAGMVPTDMPKSHTL